jgi:hypothetical protein
MAKLKAAARSWASPISRMEVTMARRTRAGTLVEIAVGTAIVAGAFLTIVELARVAATMQLDSIFSRI